MRCNFEDLILELKADPEFLNTYGLVFLYINEVEDKLGGLLLITKYSEVSQTDQINQTTRNKIANDFSLTLGQKIHELKKYLKDENLINKLEELNNFRRFLAHNTFNPDESGNWVFSNKKNITDDMRTDKIRPYLYSEIWDKHKMEAIKKLCIEILRILDKRPEFEGLG